MRSFPQHHFFGFLDDTVDSWTVLTSDALAEQLEDLVQAIDLPPGFLLMSGKAPCSFFRLAFFAIIGSAWTIAFFRVVVVFELSSKSSLNVFMADV